MKANANEPATRGKAVVLESAFKFVSLKERKAFHEERRIAAARRQNK